MNDPKGGVAKVMCPTSEAMGQIPVFHRTYSLLAIISASINIFASNHMLQCQSKAYSLSTAAWYHIAQHSVKAHMQSQGKGHMYRTISTTYLITTSLSLSSAWTCSILVFLPIFIHLVPHGRRPVIWICLTTDQLYLKI